MYDAIVIGGGFYGTVIASYLAKQRKLQRILLLERESKLITHASYNNQARVHNGYHYPRSFTTAYRSRINFPRFVQDFPTVIKQDFTKIYAIARYNSKVTAKQFERFCREIGAQLMPAPQSIKALFNLKLIEEVFLVQEYAFNAAELALWAQTELAECNVEQRFNTEAKSLHVLPDNTLQLQVEHAGNKETFVGRYLFNCTYSGLNQLKGDFTGIQAGLKHEIAEMALLKVPAVLNDLGITVMDGPFFSMMPFPARSVHTLSHVRYTPHFNWQDAPSIDPYQQLKEYAKVTRIERMLRDVSRYLPLIAEAVYIDSLFEIKTVLTKNENDDGRPILLEQDRQLPNCHSILGGKIDNIYDILERLDNQAFS